MENEQLINFFLSQGTIHPELAKEISRTFQKKQLAKGEYFLREGLVSNEYLLLGEGYIRSFCYDVDGKDITTGFYTAMQPVFEVNSFFNRTIAMENFQAVTDCHGYVLTFEQLNRMFHAYPEFREFGRSVLVKGYSALKLRMISLITQSAEARYAALLKTRPEIFQHVPLKHIASYLGITDTSLSRLRKDFARI